MKFLQKLKELFERYERHISTMAFIFGFTWDQLTLTRIDLWLDNLFLLGYLVLAAAGIILLNAFNAGRLQNNFLSKYYKFIPPIMQFAFGGLFSGFFVFYSRSASLAVSWPFLLFLFGLLVGNEFFRKSYLRLTFQMSVFFIALFSYTTLITPVILGSMGERVFMLGGLVSLAVMGFVVLVFRYLAPERLRESRWMLLLAMSGIYATFHVFYFTNILPPIPLSLKEFGIYHSVVPETTTGYRVSYEKLPGIALFGDYNRTFHRVGNAPVYIYSSVFAPTTISTKVFHEWSYYDEKKGVWVATDRIVIPVVGGRDGGYRGYTFKRNVFAGRWRVNVVTERGQLLGRTPLIVEQVDFPPILETVIR